MELNDRTLGSALMLSAGDRILRSRTSLSFRLSQIESHSRKSSSPQNAATSTLQACAPPERSAKEFRLNQTNLPTARKLFGVAGLTQKQNQQGVKNNLWQ